MVNNSGFALGVLRIIPIVIYYFAPGGLADVVDLSSPIIPPKWVARENVTTISALRPAGFKPSSDGGGATTQLTYIIRAELNGGHFIGGAEGLEKKDFTFVSPDGSLHTTTQVEFLVAARGSLLWMEVVGSESEVCLPRHVFKGGIDPDGSTGVGVCRVWVGGGDGEYSLVVGRFTNKLGKCEVSLTTAGGAYQTFSTFDILVENRNRSSCPGQDESWNREGKNVKWVPSSSEQVNDTTALTLAGWESGVPYYIGRTNASSGGALVPGKVNLKDKTLSYTTLNDGHGQLIHTKSFDLLVYPPYSLRWVEGVTLNKTVCLPKNAFRGGEDPETKTTFYICRAWSNKNWVVGKFTEKSGRCEIIGSTSGDVQQYDDDDEFDILVETGFWACSTYLPLNSRNPSIIWIVVGALVVATIIMAFVLYKVNTRLVYS